MFELKATEQEYLEAVRDAYRHDHNGADPEHLHIFWATGDKGAMLFGICAL